MVTERNETPKQLEFVGNVLAEIARNNYSTSVEIFMQGLRELITTKSLVTADEFEYHLAGPLSVACSFCGKGELEVNQLIAGPNIFICDACVAICNTVLRSLKKEVHMKFESSPDYLLYQRSRELMDKGDYVTALEGLTESAELSPHFKTFESIGECYLQIGEPRKAVKFLAAAAGLGNSQSRPFFLLAKALLELDDADLARIKLKQALELNPDYKAAHDLLETIPDTET